MFILINSRKSGGKVAPAQPHSRRRGRSPVDSRAIERGYGVNEPLSALRRPDLARRGRQEPAEQADRRQEGADVIDEGQAGAVGEQAQKRRADAAEAERQAEE